MTHAVEEHVYGGSALLPVLGTVRGRLRDVAVAVCGSLHASQSGDQW